MIKKIGLCTPSSNIVSATTRLNRAKQNLEKLGISVVEGDLCRKSHFYSSGTICERINELNQIIHSDVDAIMFTIGGLTSISIIPYIDYDYLRLNRKIFIGNSDITSILLAVNSLSNCPVYYFPNFLPAFGEFEWTLKQNVKYFKDIILSKPDYYEYKMPSYWTDDWINWLTYFKSKKKNSNLWKVLYPGKTIGRLVGGNLQTLVKTVGTKFSPNFDDAILFLEDTRVNAEMTESCIMILRNMGVLDKIKGLIVGKCELYDSQGMSLDYGEWIFELIGKGIPCFSGFDCGHTQPAMPLRIGGIYEVDCSANNKVELRYFSDEFDSKNS